MLVYNDRENIMFHDNVGNKILIHYNVGSARGTQ